MSPAASANVTVPAFPVTEVWSPVLVPDNVVSPFKVMVRFASPVMMVKILLAVKLDPGVMARV